MLKWNRFLISCFLGIILCSLCFSQAKNKAPGSNFAHRPGTVLVGDTDSLKAVVYGSGKTPIILITSHTHGSYFYEDFIERNWEKAKFHVITPPGMGGTPAYPWPDQADDFESQPWNSRFKEDLAVYIQTHFDEKPYLMTVWYAGVNVALQMIDQYPDLLKGALFVSRSPYYRWYNSENADSTKLYDVQAQRKRLVKTIDFWEGVSEDTWHSNMFNGQFFTQDDSLGTALKLKEARQPIVIEQRYFIEYMVNDLGPLIENVKIPVHIMSNFLSRNNLMKLMSEGNSQGLSSASLQNPGYGSLKDWQISEKKNFSSTVFDNLGLMLWRDMPEQFDKAFFEFINKVEQGQ